MQKITSPLDSQYLHAYLLFVSFSQLLRQTNLFTFSALCFATMWPASGNSLSHGTEVAGLIKYLIGTADSCGWVPARLATTAPASLSRWWWIPLCTNSGSCYTGRPHLNQSLKTMKRGGGSLLWLALLWCHLYIVPAAGPSRLVQTSSRAPLVRHFKSLKRGSSTAAILSQWWLSVARRWDRCFVKVVLSETSMLWCRWQKAGKTTEHETCLTSMKLSYKPVVDSSRK